MLGTSLPLGRPHYLFFFRCLSDLCTLCFLLECLWLEERFSHESFPLECDFFGVVLVVFFLLHPLLCRLMHELTWELVCRSVWESSCKTDCWLLVWCFFFFELEEEEEAPFTWLVAGFSFITSALRSLQHFMCTLSHCLDGNNTSSCTSHTYSLHCNVCRRCDWGITGCYYPSIDRMGRMTASSWICHQPWHQSLS